MIKSIIKSAVSGGVAPVPFELKRILLGGDSTTYGKGANPLGIGFVEGAHVDSPARQLARKLTALGSPADSHSVVGLGNNASASSTELYFNRTPDVAVTLNGWDELSFLSIGGDIYENSGAGILTYSFDNIDTVAIGLPIRTYGIIQYRIDGGDWIQVDENGGGADDLLRIELDLGVKGAHTVEFERVTSTVYVVYCEAWDSASQYVVVPWGARGYTSSDLNDDARPWSYKAALSYVPFDAVVLNIGINDIRSGGANTPQATYEQNVTDYVNAIYAANPDADVFLQIPNDISTGLTYLPTSITALATTLNCTLLDTRNAVNMSTYAIADAAGNMVDTLHPSDTGYSSEYDLFTPIIKSVIES